MTGRHRLWHWVFPRCLMRNPYFYRCPHGKVWFAR